MSMDDYENVTRSAPASRGNDDLAELAKVDPEGADVLQAAPEAFGIEAVAVFVPGRGVLSVTHVRHW